MVSNHLKALEEIELGQNLDIREEEKISRVSNLNIEIREIQIKEHIWMKKKKCDMKYVTVLNLQLKDNVSFVRVRNRGKGGNELYLQTKK